MYKCSICNTITPAGTTCHKVVVDKRNKVYPYRPKAHAGYIRKGEHLVKSPKTRDREDDRGGHGWEIAHEANCCPKCFAKLVGEEIENKTPAKANA